MAYINNSNSYGQRLRTTDRINKVKSNVLALRQWYNQYASVLEVTGYTPFLRYELL